MTDRTHGGKERLAKNTIFSLMAWFSPIVIGFVTTPVLVRGLGVEQYGILAIILGFLSYSFTFGTGKAVAKFVPEYNADGKSEKIPEVVSATFWLSLIIALAGSIVIALFASFIVSEVLLIQPESRDTAQTAFYLACATGLVMMVGQPFQFFMQGMHSFGNYVILTTLNGLLLGVGNIVLVLNGFGLVELMGWNLTVGALIAMLFYIQSRRRFPELKINFRIDRKILNSVLNYGGNIILFQIFGNALYIFERTWVTRKFGPQTLTFYSVSMLLAIYLHGLTGSFIQAIFPRVNELLNSSDKLIDLYQKTMKIVLAVVTFACISYICAGRMFLGLWVNADFAANSYDLLVIHSLTFAFIAIAIMPLHIAEAFRLSSLTAVVTCAWLVIAVPLMIFAAGEWKSEGIALSRLAAVVITFPIIFYVEKRFFGGVLWRFWLASCMRIGIATLVTSVVEYQVFHRFAESWTTLIFGIMASGLAFAGVLLATGFLTRNEREMLRDLITNGRVFGFSANS